MMDDRITYIDFYGRRYPLCLTVSAQERINKAYGGLSNMAALMDSNGEESVTILANLLHILMTGGADRKKALAWMSGETVDTPEVPSKEILSGLLTLADVAKYQPLVIEAVNVSSRPTVETEPEKNAETTQE